MESAHWIWETTAPMMKKGTTLALASTSDRVPAVCMAFRSRDARRSFAIHSKCAKARVVPLSGRIVTSVSSCNKRPRRLSNVGEPLAAFVYVMKSLCI